MGAVGRRRGLRWSLTEAREKFIRAGFFIMKNSILGHFKIHTLVLVGTDNKV